MMTKQQLYYLHWVMSQTVATSTNKWIQKLTERKWPYMTENPNYDKFRKIPNISRYKHFAFSARTPGRVSLPEFPTSATFYVTILSNDQVMPNVESVNDLDSFTIFSACLSNERAWYLTICTNKYTEKVRRGCARRHMPEAAYTDNEIKRYVGAHDNDKPNAKKRKEKAWKILYEISVTKILT